ncbi:MAG: hypothetical protein GX640_04120 [Fibrobacter sp.]|nr:hypothetical protein [Fibrobacter sp.]
MIDIGELLGYEGVANNLIYMVNPVRILLGFELHVSTVDGLQRVQLVHSELADFLSSYVPDNSWVSFYHISTCEMPDIASDALDGATPLSMSLERSYQAKLNSTKIKVHRTYMTICIPVTMEKKDEGIFGLVNFIKGVRGFSDAEKHEALLEVIERTDILSNAILSKFNNRIFRLHSAQLVQFLSLLANHKFLSNVSDPGSVFGGDIFFDSGDIMVLNQPGTVKYGNVLHRVLSQRAFDKENRLPVEMHSGWGQIFLDNNLLNTEYIIHHAIKFTNIKDINKKVRSRRNLIAFQEMIASRYPMFKKTDTGVDCFELGKLIDEVDRQIQASNERYLEMFYHVHYWGATEKDLTNNYKSIMSVCKQKLPLKQEKFNIKASWLSLFPGCEMLDPIRLILPKRNVRHFMPLELPRRVRKHPKNRHLIHLNNDCGSIDSIDLFDSERANAWNGVVVGGTGSGKSFFYQGLLAQYMVYKPRIAIIDYGGAGAGSYRNLVINNGGQYLEIDISNTKFGINPFDVKLFTDDDMTTVDLDVLAMLKSRIVRFLEADRSIKNVPATVKSRIHDHLISYYKDNFNNKDLSCNLNEFAESYLKNDKELIDSINPYKILYPFIGTGEREGEYARFFRQTQHVENKDLICFDLEGLKQHATLSKVVLPILIEWIVDDIVAKGEYKQKKIVACDEVAKDLQGGDLMDVYGGLVRKLRKHNASIQFITQSLKDIFDSPVGDAIMQNSSYYWLVGPSHNEDDLRRLKASNIYGTNMLSDWEILQICSQQAKRDTWFFSPYASSKVRYSPTREFSLMTTTDPNEKVLLKEAMQKLGHDHVTEDVIKYVLNNSRK